MLNWFYTGCIIFVVCVYALTHTWPISPLLEATHYALEQNENWWREWISALSGWAAAIGALIAAGLTIAKLREQIADQKKQTMHITGDGQPILEFDKLGNEACLVIKNYNRRKLQLVAIENRSSHIIMASMLNRSIGYDDNFKVQANQTIDYFGGHSFFCSGWENQSTSIPKLEIKCKIHTESLSDYPPRMNAIIHCILCDEHNTRIQLSVKETA